jgi:hypothetical protein
LRLRDRPLGGGPPLAFERSRAALRAARGPPALLISFKRPTLLQCDPRYLFAKQAVTRRR